MLPLALCLAAHEITARVVCWSPTRRFPTMSEGASGKKVGGNRYSNRAKVRCIPVTLHVHGYLHNTPASSEAPPSPAGGTNHGRGTPTDGCHICIPPAMIEVCGGRGSAVAAGGPAAPAQPPPPEGGAEQYGRMTSVAVQGGNAGPHRAPCLPLLLLLPPLCCRRRRALLRT